MACNGRNHPSDCQCSFRGGHPRSRQPSRSAWSLTHFRRHFSRPNTLCKVCGRPIYYVPGPKGGGAYYNEMGPPWKKHRCMKWRKPYSPFNEKGQPKLRNRRSTFERHGWIPLFIRKVEAVMHGTIVDAVAFDDPTVLHFGVLSEINPNRKRPIYFRRRAADLVEINFFPADDEGHVSVKGFAECSTELDLYLKRNPQKKDG